MSEAETQIEQFIQEPNTVEALVISPEEAQAAGKAFTELCNDELLKHAGSVRQMEVTDEYPQAHLEKNSIYEDGSSLKAGIASRSGRLPDGHIDKRMGVKDAPFEIRLRAWTGKGDELTIQESEYEFDEVSGTVKKKLYQPMDDLKRVLGIANIAEVEAPEGEEDEAAEDALFAELEHALTGQELEQEMGLDESILVGPQEVEQLRALVEGMELVQYTKR
jgi:hypothetical protein